MKLEKKRGSLEHLESLSTLVEELKKDEPNQEYLKKHMQNIGLKFENDPIENIGKIIAELNSFEFKEQ